MEFLLVLAVAGLCWAVWSKARQHQKYLDEIEYLDGIISGQAAALKLKREQDKLRDQADAQKDQEIAEKIRATGDKSAVLGFVRDSFAPKSPGPGEPVSRPEASDDPSDD